jgi:hypothetical protein
MSAEVGHQQVERRKRPCQDRWIFNQGHSKENDHDKIIIASCHVYLGLPLSQFLVHFRRGIGEYLWPEKTPANLPFLCVLFDMHFHMIS